MAFFESLKGNVQKVTNSLQNFNPKNAFFKTFARLELPSSSRFFAIFRYIYLRILIQAETASIRSKIYPEKSAPAAGLSSSANVNSFFEFVTWLQNFKDGVKKRKS